MMRLVGSRLCSTVGVAKLLVVRQVAGKAPPLEDSEAMRARLLYQSRKRGIRENDLLLSSFANIHLATMTIEELHDYDRIINGVDNEWDLYKYMVGSEPTPVDLDSEVMRSLKVFASNPDRQKRLFMPELY